MFLVMKFYSGIRLFSDWQFNNLTILGFEAANSVLAELNGSITPEILYSKIRELIEEE